jgi:apolipoprotein D and lipocalin family protein
MLKRILAIMSITLAGCSSQPELKPVNHVDLDRFMGKWYVIANIPTFLEKNAYNAVETYERNPDGTVDTTFTFRKGGFDGELKEFNPKGFVREDPSNAIWGMRFIWPIKADYRIVYLDDDYSRTVIGRNKRDFVWVMARTPTIPDSDYEQIVEAIEDMGYDTSELQKVPQRW